MDVKKLFQGIAVVIDDEIDNEHATISSIAKVIEDNFDIQCLKLSRPPSVSSVKALCEATMVILDWMLNENNIPPGVQSGEALEEVSDLEKVNVIKQLLDKSLSPVFIVTSNPQKARAAIENSEVKSDLDHRLFVKGKSELDDKDKIEHCLNEWLTKNHESYVLKEWEYIADEAKFNFFRLFGRDDTKWADALWSRLKEDDESECQDMFGEYLTRCIVNQMDDFVFESKVLEREKQSGDDRNKIIKTIVNNEKIKWAPEGYYPTHPHAGDLYYCQKGKTFRLNIRADCDTARTSKSSEETLLYCIEGKRFLHKHLDGIKNSVDDDGRLHFAGQAKFQSDDDDERVDEILKTEAIQLDELYDHVRGKTCNVDYVNRRINPELDVINSHGKLLGHRNEHYLTISFPQREDNIAYKKYYESLKDIVAIRFIFKLVTPSFSDLNNTNSSGDSVSSGKGSSKADKWIYFGKLLPPYINEIQQECTHWICRIGSMPTPDEFYL